MKTILLITAVTLGTSAITAQAATLPRLATISAPAALTSLPTMPAAVSASRPLAGLYPLVNRQFLSNIGRVGSSLVTGPLNLPGLGTLRLGGLVGIGEDVIVGLGGTRPPPRPPVGLPDGLALLGRLFQSPSPSAQ